jgi:hypothetical protein
VTATPGRRNGCGASGLRDQDTPEPLQAAARPLTLDDVRFNWHGRVMAAPLWAFRRKSAFDRPEPIAALWRNVVRALRREADADYHRRLAEYRADLAAVEAYHNDPAAHEDTGFRLSHGWRPREPERRVMGARRLCPGDDQYKCAVCRQWYFGGKQPSRYCSERCYRRRVRGPRRSRARPRQTATCAQCGEPFEQTRGDARYCSTRCRVAAHRKK